MAQEEQNEDVLVVDQNLWESMTEEEQEKYLHELVMSKRTFIIDGVTWEYDSDIGPITMSFG